MEALTTVILVRTSEHNEDFILEGCAVDESGVRKLVMDYVSLYFGYERSTLSCEVVGETVTVIAQDEFKMEFHTARVMVIPAERTI